MPLSQDEQKKYKTLYLQTARQYIKELQDNIHRLQSGNETTDAIDTLHRAAHSLKGQSAMMNYPSMSTLSLVMEQIFMKKKEKTLELSEELLTKLSEAIEHMNTCLDAIDITNKEKDLSQDSENLRNLTNIDTV